jgi:hypothetical protein
VLVTDKKRTSSGHPRTEGLKGLSGQEFLEQLKADAKVTWLDILGFVSSAGRPVTTQDVLARFRRSGMVSPQDAYSRLSRLLSWKYIRRAGKVFSPVSSRTVMSYEITDYGKQRSRRK